MALINIGIISYQRALSKHFFEYKSKFLICMSEEDPGPQVRDMNCEGNGRGTCLTAMGQ